MFNKSNAIFTFFLQNSLPITVASFETREQFWCHRYRGLHQSAPSTSLELCISSPVAATAKWNNLRSAVQGNHVISYCRTKQYGQRGFAYFGSALWNSLPLTVRGPLLSLRYVLQSTMIHFHSVSV